MSLVILPVSYTHLDVYKRQTLPSVATFIPKNPASTDSSAPNTYKIAVVTLWRPKPISRASTTITIAMILYSLVRNAIAPSLMYPAISFILSLPSSALPTHVARETATIRPITVSYTHLQRDIHQNQMRSVLTESLHHIPQIHALLRLESPVS